jgi:hypothetical protein
MFKKLFNRKLTIFLSSSLIGLPSQEKLTKDFISALALASTGSD